MATTPEISKDKLSIVMTVPSAGGTINKTLSISAIEKEQILETYVNQVQEKLVNPLQYLYGSTSANAIVKNVYVIDYTGIYEVS